MPEHIASIAARQRSSEPHTMATGLVSRTSYRYVTAVQQSVDAACGDEPVASPPARDAVSPTTDDDERLSGSDAIRCKISRRRRFADSLVKCTRRFAILMSISARRTVVSARASSNDRDDRRPFAHRGPGRSRRSPTSGVIDVRPSQRRQSRPARPGHRNEAQRQRSRRVELGSGGDRRANIIERHHSPGRLLAGLALGRRRDVLARPTPTHRRERRAQRAYWLRMPGSWSPYRRRRICHRSTSSILSCLLERTQPCWSCADGGAHVSSFWGWTFLSAR